MRIQISLHALSESRGYTDGSYTIVRKAKRQYLVLIPRPGEHGATCDTYRYTKRMLSSSRGYNQYSHEKQELGRRGGFHRRFGIQEQHHLASGQAVARRPRRQIASLGHVGNLGKRAALGVRRRTQRSLRVLRGARSAAGEAHSRARAERLLPPATK